MTQVKKLWPLLTATHRYDKSISTLNRGRGQQIEAPILAYLIETAQGRILYDVGCDHAKIAAWKKAQSEVTTQARRPDLWAAYKGDKA